MIHQTKCPIPGSTTTVLLSLIALFVHVCKFKYFTYVISLWSLYVIFVALSVIQLVITLITAKGNDLIYYADCMATPN